MAFDTSRSVDEFARRRQLLQAAARGQASPLASAVGLTPPTGIGIGDPRLNGSQNAGGARGDARLDGSRNIGGALGDPRLNGSQNIGGGLGDARLDGSQNVVAPVAPLAAAAASSPSLSAPAVSPLASSATTGGYSNGSLASRPESALQRVDDVTALAPPKNAYANGGPVRGKGTGTSDSISARLSDGEFVVPADVVKVIGVPALQAMVNTMHKQAGKAPTPGYADGGLVRRIDEEDPTAWNKLAAMYPNAQQPRYVAPIPGSSLASQALQQGIAQGNALLAGGRNGGQALVRAIDNQQGPNTVGLASPLAASLAAPPAPYNGTGGQAQVRAVDNAIIASADDVANQTQAAQLQASPRNYALGAGNEGFLGRDYIRGGAAPGQPQGIGSTPGTQIQSNYGYGDTITATADKTGRFNSFSGVGTNKPGLADYAAGMQRAAANREELAAMRADREAPRPPTDPLAYASVINSQAANRKAGQETVNAAGAQPYSLAASAANTGLAQATTANTLATANRTSAMTPGEVEGQGIHAAVAKLDLKGRQRIDDLGTKLATEADPTKVSQMHSQLLALLGKDKPEEYVVQHAAGGVDPTDPLGQRKLGDNIVIANKRTGKYEVLPLGASKPAEVPPGMKLVGTSGGKPVYEDANGKRFASN